MNIQHCRSCNAEIVWLKTKLGKSIPVNASTITEEDALYDHTRHISHFSTCPQAKKWSGKGKNNA